ncbi:hypothetical protein F4819DRAFT_489963 [Hypoxylon fuscum]|nr:hypothetical protein F4819DRAFT_489963 [Hypoxylon fuscum]
MVLGIVAILCIPDLWSYLRGRRRANALHYVREQRDIASFEILGADNTLEGRLQSRAIPNGRLKEPFNIDSSFTTVDPAIHHEFLQRAKVDIDRMDPQHCIEFFNAADVALKRTLDYYKPLMEHVPLASVARVFTLMAVLNKFFAADVEGMDVAATEVATQKINDLWVDSKDTSQPVSASDQDDLQLALWRLLPDCFPCEHKDNPINIIIPAYETMWRVVLLTFISAGFRSPDEATTEQFQQVVEAVPECFGPLDASSQELALAFAKEGLRLYPPTRHIHRAVPTDQEDGHETKVADVEACHRNTTIWGADALVFRPSRWFDPSSADKRRAYFPFGVGPHTCPAAARFGNRAVIILAVVLARHLGAHETGSIVYFWSTKIRSNGLKAPLPAQRNDMERWTLEMSVPN